MKAAELHRELELRGVELLAVSEHHANPEVLVVYLHGLAGQAANGEARRIIAAVPGVIAATDSIGTPAIVLARVQTEPRHQEEP